MDSFLSNSQQRHDEPGEASKAKDKPESDFLKSNPSGMPSKANRNGSVVISGGHAETFRKLQQQLPPLQMSKSLKTPRELSAGNLSNKTELRKAKSYIDLISNHSRDLNSAYEGSASLKRQDSMPTLDIYNRHAGAFDSPLVSAALATPRPDIFLKKNISMIHHNKSMRTHRLNNLNNNSINNINNSNLNKSSGGTVLSKTNTLYFEPLSSYPPSLANTVATRSHGSPRKKNRIHTISSPTDGVEKHQRRLVRRDRHKPSPSDPTYYYTQHTIESDSISVLPSSTGIDPLSEYVSSDFQFTGFMGGNNGTLNRSRSTLNIPRRFSMNGSNAQDGAPRRSFSKGGADKMLFRGVSQGGSKDTQSKPGKPRNSTLHNSLNTNCDMSSHYLHVFSTDNNSPKPSMKTSNQFNTFDEKGSMAAASMSPSGKSHSSVKSKKERESPSFWQLYCSIVTFFAPAFVLSLCGMNTKSRQQAWREKIGLISIIFLLTNFVGFFTFAFNSFVCGKQVPRVHYKDIPSDSAILHGSLFNISTIIQSASDYYESVDDLPKFLEIWEYAGGADASLLVQNVNGPCSDFIKADDGNAPVPMTEDGLFTNYFPCVLLNLNGSPRTNPLQTRIIHRPNGLGFEAGSSIDNMELCHIRPHSRDYLYKLGNDINVYYLWNDLPLINNDIVVYLGDVIDLTRLRMLQPFKLEEPLQSLLNNGTMLRGSDISHLLSKSRETRQAAKCLVQLAKVGVIDTDTIGCITSNIILIISLTFIVSVIIVKFVFALYFEWFLSWKLGASPDKMPPRISSAVHSIRSATSGVSNFADSLDQVIQKYISSRKDAKIALDDSSFNDVHQFNDLMASGEKKGQETNGTVSNDINNNTMTTDLDVTERVTDNYSEASDSLNGGHWGTTNSSAVNLEGLNKTIVSELMGETLVSETASNDFGLNHDNSLKDKVQQMATQTRAALPAQGSRTHVVEVESRVGSKPATINISLSASSVEQESTHSVANVSPTNVSGMNPSVPDLTLNEPPVKSDGVTSKVENLVLPTTGGMSALGTEVKSAHAGEFNYPQGSFHELLDTICLVTAYSESEEGLRSTLDSIAASDYPSNSKLIIVVCDGLIIGSGNKQSTPEIAVSMITDFLVPPNEVALMPYIAVAHGAKRYNLAKIYAGNYKYKGEQMMLAHPDPVPIVCIVKCGDEWERETPGVKPGNRGKRDSQVLLMSFLQRIMFNERMTDFEHALYYTIWQLTKKDVMDYEAVLMVDADTKIRPDSLQHMVSCLVKDPMIMGICGETQIANKMETWVTMIQVFEYFISHHLTKSFESVFGGVTCLPGCFSIYRIKAPKGPHGYWVPILANPDVVERYAINCVETLHQKNLLLLGEDRYLSTLMLKTFPTRKQIFVPQAKCETIAPSEFGVLLDQRRRWINSTVHNLMELIIVRDLCGVFCISMQFVVLIEFIGTLTLPAALLFTFFVIGRAIVETPVPVIPLVLLGLIVGIPGLLIVVTAHHWAYVLWMLVYLISLPIWNFILPLNACKCWLRF